jgi:hypothetical protein
MLRTPTVLVAGAALAACSRRSPPAVSGGGVAGAPATPLDGQATPGDAAHLLARLTFGPRPGQAEALARTGLAAWLEAQLRPNDLADPAGAAALAPFHDALAPFADLEDAAQAEAATMVQDGAPGGETKAKNNAKNMAKRELLLETQMTTIVRHVASERAVLGS